MTPGTGCRVDRSSAQRWYAGNQRFVEDRSNQIENRDTGVLRVPDSVADLCQQEHLSTWAETFSSLLPLRQPQLFDLLYERVCQVAAVLDRPTETLALVVEFLEDVHSAETSHHGA